MVIGQGIATGARLLWAGLTHSTTKMAGALIHNPEALSTAISATKGVAGAAYVPFGKWGAMAASAAIRVPLAIDTAACFLQDTRRQREIIGGESKQSVSREAASDATFWSTASLGILGGSALFKVPQLFNPEKWMGPRKLKVKGFGALTTVAALGCLAMRYITTKGSIDAAFDPSAGPGILSVDGPMLMVDDPSSAYNGFSTFLQKSAETRAYEDATYGRAGSGFRNTFDGYVEGFGNWMYGANTPAMNGIYG
jgi:hypothetical protein